MNNISFQKIGTTNVIVLNDESIGHFNFTINESTLYIENIHIKEEFRAQGYYQMALAKILTENEIEIIESVLVQDNKTAFLKALGLNKTARLPEAFENITKDKILSAIKETPAYKIRKSIGYSTILEVYPEKEAQDKKEDGLKLVVTKSDK